MRCRTCMRTIRSKDPTGRKNHNWDYNQCYYCHYLLLYSSPRIRGPSLMNGSMAKKTSKKIEKHRMIITEKNIELYCKISQIIRGKKCRPKVVLQNQKLRRRYENEM